MNLDFLKNIQTKYSHTNKIEGNNFNVDCSGLIVFLLNYNKYNSSIKEIKKFTKDSGISNDRLFVADFIRYFKKIKEKKISSKYWTVVPLSEIKKYDICVLQSNEKVSKNNHHRHTFMVLDVEDDFFTILHSTNKHPNKSSGVQIEKIQIKNNRIIFDDFTEELSEFIIGRVSN